MRQIQGFSFITTFTGLSLLASACPGVFTNVDLERRFNKGYGYAIFQHGLDSPTGALAASKSMVPRSFEIDARGRYIVGIR